MKTRTSAITDCNIAAHSAPSLREKADYILQVDLAPYGLPERREQLWTKRVGARRFRLCCIPFFTYGMALGDTVQADRAGMVTRVVQKGGHRVLRIAILKRSSWQRVHIALHEWAERAGALYEWYHSHYLAVDLTGAKLEIDLKLIESLAEAKKVVFEIL